GELLDDGQVADFEVGDQTGEECSRRRKEGPAPAGGRLTPAAKSLEELFEVHVDQGRDADIAGRVCVLLAMEWTGGIELQSHRKPRQVTAARERHQPVDAQARHLLSRELLTLAGAELEVGSFEIAAFALSAVEVRILDAPAEAPVECRCS